MRVVRSQLAILSVLVVLGATACAGDTAAGWDARSVQESVQDAPFTPIVTNSNLGLGATRLAIALLTPEQALVEGATVTMRLYRLAEEPEDGPNTAEAAGEFTLTARVLDIAGEHQQANPGVARSANDGNHSIALIPAEPALGRMPNHEGALTTVYTATVDFDRTGYWGAELDATVDGETYNALRLRMIVQAHTSEPAVGDAAPLSEQPTLRDADITDLTTADPPNPEMHEKTVAEAVATGKPVVVAFVTPAFCQTRFCGPVLSAAVVPLWEDVGDRVEFVHIEPFDLARARQGTLEPTPTTQQWGLLAEPAIFLLDGQGRVAAKFEGVIAPEELREAVMALLP